MEHIKRDRVAGTDCYSEASKDGAKAIQVFLKKWLVLMTVLILQELSVFHLDSIDMSMMDLFESIGDEEDFV